MPYFTKKFTIVVQFDSSTKTLFASKFKIENGSYTEPETRTLTMSINLLGNTPSLFRALRLHQVLTVVQGLPDQNITEEIKEMANSHTLFSFIAISEESMQLRIVFCGYSEEGADIRCIIGFTYNLTDSPSTFPTSGHVQSLQLTENSIMVILPNRIHEIPLGEPARGINYTYPYAMNFVQYFDGKWFGLSDNNRLCVLEQDSYNGGDLIERRFFDNKLHLYTNLVATENYLMAVYKDSNFKQGVTIFFYMDDEFFNKQKIKEKVTRLLAQETNKKQSFKGDKSFKDKQNRTMASLDYSNPQTFKVKYFHEWNGNLILFGQDLLLLFSVPPTTNAPAGQKLLFQTIGTLNQTYNYDGDNIIYIMPLSTSANRCGCLKTRVLKNSTTELNGIPRQHLFLNDIGSGSTVLSFEKIDDSDLENIDKIDIEIYFKENQNFIKSSYSVHFKYYKGSRWYWLWIPLGCIILVFVLIFGLCISKLSKAIKGRPSISTEEAETVLQIRNSKEAQSPLLNEKVPERLAPLRTSWKK